VIRASAILLVLFATGCSTNPSLLWPNDDFFIPVNIVDVTTRPLDTNYSATPVYASRASAGIKKVTVRGASVEWSSNAVGDVARRHGLEKLYYADIEVFSVSIFGVGWSREQLHLYGE